MIRDLMEHSVVVGAADRLRAALLEKQRQLDTEDEDAGGAAEHDVEYSDIGDLIEEIEHWKAKEAQDLGGGTKPVYITNDPIASLVQSVAEDYFFRSGLVQLPHKSAV